MYGALRQISGLQTFLTGELLLIKRKITKEETLPGPLEYLVEQWYGGHLVKQEDTRLILLLPAREEPDIIFVCNLELKRGCQFQHLILNSYFIIQSGDK